MFMSTQELIEIFSVLTDIKEFCIGQCHCTGCPFCGSPLCECKKPRDWVVNNPSNPCFRFF